MILGIDFGASTTDAALLRGKKIVKLASVSKPLHSKKEIEEFLFKNCFNAFPIDGIAITGGKSCSFTQKILGMMPIHVNEISAIGNGAAFLSKKKRFLAVSMGTGTCIVLFEKGKSSHVIGTGIGGGTILGLSKLLLVGNDIGKLNSFASKGDTAKIDLTICDVVGKNFCTLGKEATASNFAKIKNYSKADLAAGIQNLVAESVAVLAVSAARSCKCGEIVFCGKTPLFPFVKKRLNAAARIFKARFIFPKRFEFATSIGAALSVEKK